MLVLARVVEFGIQNVHTYKYFVVSVIASCMVAVDNGDIFEQYAKKTPQF